MRPSLYCLLISVVVGLAPATGAPEDKPAPKAEKTAPKPTIKTNPNASSVITEVAGRTFEQWKADLKHPDPSTRAEAILAITYFGPLTAEAVPALIDRCHDRDASPRVKAIIALGFVEMNPRDTPK